MVAGAVLARRLVGLDSIRGLPLTALRAEDGVALLRVVAGSSRVAPDDPLAPTVVNSCGGLLLAIRIAGARLAARPNWNGRSRAAARRRP
jgi:hypothetical protein